MRELLPRAVSVTALCVAAIAHAQPAPNGSEPSFLVPTTFQASSGAPITVHFESIDSFQERRVSWPETIRWLFVRSPGFQENRSQSDAPRSAGAPEIPLTLEHPGVTIIGIDLPARELRVPRATLQQLGAPPAAGAAPDGDVPVKMIQSVKTLLRVVSAQSDDTTSVATSKTGQTVEIRPLMDPVFTPIDSDIALRLYVGGDAASDGVLHAIHAQTRTDEILKIKPGGFARLRLSAPGVWRVVYQCARPEGPGHDGSWTVYSATLIFSTSPAPAENPAPDQPPPPATEAAK
jgi:hypothetical protein